MSLPSRLGDGVAKVMLVIERCCCRVILAMVLQRHRWPWHDVAIESIVTLFWIILCGNLIQLNWVVSTYNFNLVNRMLIINESRIGAFLQTTLLELYPYYYGMHIIYFPCLLSTNHKCTQPC
jgi:hypothetical protein